MSSPDWQLIDRYLAGEASPAEREHVQAWIDARPGRAEALAQLKAPQRTEPQWNADAAWARFSERGKAPAPVRAIPVQRIATPALWRIAAVLVVAVGLPAAWLATRRSAATATLPMREIFTLNGQRTTVTLDDGSRVSLNGASHLRYAASFGKTNRDVYLDGEAYFDVVHDAARPFRVHARAALAEDLGTRFTVSAYAEQASVEVAVAQGRVALGRDSVAGARTVQLAAGDVGTLPDSGAPTVAHVASLDRYVGWAAGSLVLDGVTLRRAVLELQRWYDVDITITDSTLARRPVVARFHGESAGQAIEALALALGAHVERRGEAYVLSPSRK
jgi:ferric-dicitrate binding protein FerR (iron transport regulator)